MPTLLNEKSLEDLITNYLTERHGYDLGVSDDYDETYGIDLGHLEAFLRATQPELIAASRVFETATNRRRFFERLRNEITKRGVVDVLRKGVRHLARTFELYIPLPSELSKQAQKRYALNRFTVIRQLHYSAVRPGQSVDMVLLINGLPILTMELKNQLTCQNTAHAVAQYRSERDPRELLFAVGRCAVHFALDDETVEMCTKLSGRDSWFLPFNKGNEDGAGNPVNPNGLRTAYLWEEILKKESLSDILEHYAQMVQERNENGRLSVKVIWPRWHQLEVVRQLLKASRTNDIGQRYLVQHSAGSGKSNSIAWLAYQLVELLKESQALFDSVIIITDRRNLDRQTRNNVRAFTHSEHLVGWSDSSNTLHQLLEGGTKIIITTVQKFSFILSTINQDLASRRFAVIIDEAHSSQSGRMSAAVNQTLAGIQDSEELDTEDEVNALIQQHIEGRQMARNANFYAFTATPKNKTLEIFGTPFEREDGEVGHRPCHVYTMKQAIEEGFIHDVLKNYTTYQSYYRIRKAIEEDPEFERKQAMRKLRYFVESQPETVRQKAEVMVEHFHHAVAHRIGGEARCMICTAGITRAIDYYQVVNGLLAERGSQYQAIVAFSGEVDYKGKRVTEASLNGFPSTKIEAKFRTGNYRFLIVADKFQTGYDEPLLHTMYVDNPLAGVRAVQTLSRLNRKRPMKEETFVLDFVNTSEEIEAAFQPFYKTTLLSRETDPNKLNDLLSEIEQYGLYIQDEVETLNTLYWTGAQREAIAPLLDTMKERFVALDDESKVACKSAIKAYVRTYDFLSTVMPEGSIDWEKKQTVLSLLLPKLPTLGVDDLTKGLIESVDFDAYRLQKQEERNIQLQNADVEIEPVPTSSLSGVREVDMEYLSVIESEFNELFGNIDWQDSELVRKQVDEVTERVKNNDDVRNAMLRNDEATANQNCDESTQAEMTKMTLTHTELMQYYFNNQDFQQRLNEMIRARVRQTINPPYDEKVLKQRIQEEFQKDFADFCDGEHYMAFDEVIRLFFAIIHAETIPDLQALDKILKRTLNCLYRAEHREEDYRSWYSELVRRFEAFLKKIYWLKEGAPVPLTATGKDPALLDTIRHFPQIESLYHSKNPKYDTFKQFYRVVYDWRNKESHIAEDIPADFLPTALHAAVALYLYATMVSAEELKDKL